MKDAVAKVEEFHKAFGLNVYKRFGSLAAIGGPARVRLMRLLAEEFDEYMAAEANNDIIEIADALGDMTYIIISIALEYGLDLPAIFAEIHSSNMTKLDKDGNPLINERGKILKGELFREPELAQLIFGEPNKLVDHDLKLSDGMFGD